MAGVEGVVGPPGVRVKVSVIRTCDRFPITDRVLAVHSSDKQDRKTFGINISYMACAYIAYDTAHGVRNLEISVRVFKTKAVDRC